MKKYLLVTARIARGSLEKTAAKLRQQDETLDLEIKSLHYTVAALMPVDFIARELAADEDWDRTRTVVIPGLCQGELEEIARATGAEVERGPKDLHFLPAFFGAGPLPAAVAETPSPIRIVAEIVEAPRLTLPEILARAHAYRAAGADLIDLGGDVSGPLPQLAETIRALQDEGFAVAVDSHQKEDIVTAARAGVDLMLSFTSENLELAKLFDCPVVVIPDDGESLDSLYRNLEQLQKWQVAAVADAILPPPTFGLAASIARYWQLRQDFPDCPLLLGLGNVTELTDCDSIGLNTLLVAMATELTAGYLLTTEVAPRCHGAVREVALARALCHRARTAETVPKYLDERLLTIKDAAANPCDREELLAMQSVIRDRNYRIFVADQIYVFNHRLFLAGNTAEELFAQLTVKDAGHAFYLGRELDKAETALRLGKRYVQDSPLDWGYLGENGGSSDGD